MSECQGMKNQSGRLMTYKLRGAYFAKNVENVGCDLYMIKNCVCVTWHFVEGSMYTPAAVTSSFPLNLRCYLPYDTLLVFRYHFAP